jgi:Methyltransferase domain
MRTEDGAIEKTQAELAEIAGRTRTDKGRSRIEYVRRDGTTVHQVAKHYTDTYARFFAHLRDEPIRLLEIGVASGASLRMWEEFFPRARLIGVDVAESARLQAGERTTVHIGDQSDVAFLDALGRTEGPFDIVIDDGGHLMEQHRTSLERLWPYVSDSGYYAIEDLRTAYEPHYGGGYLHENSTIERLKQQIDAIHDQAQAPRLVEGVGAIWFAPGLALLCKAGLNPDGAGSRVRSGADRGSSGKQR